MLKKQLSLIISFNRTTDAMAFEDYALKNSISGRLIPLPKEISAGCGLSWKCNIIDKDIILKALDDINIKYDKISEIMI